MQKTTTKTPFSSKSLKEACEAEELKLFKRDALTALKHAYGQNFPIPKEVREFLRQK